MNPEIKKLWINALLSGEYIQGKRWLNGTDGFCCLGVLCDLHRKLHPDPANKWQPQNIGQPVYHGEDKVLSYAVRIWAGLESRNPSIPRDEEEARTGKHSFSLAEANDGGKTFPQIVELIRKHF